MCDGAQDFGEARPSSLGLVTGSALARRLADKGDVIGIWPLGSQFGSLDSYVSALIDTAATVGIAHVGVGIDLFGLGGFTVIPAYAQFAQLEDLMAKAASRAMRSATCSVRIFSGCCARH